LVVDTHADTTKVIARILRAAGYRVTPAFSIAEAMEKCVGMKFDLMITDIELRDGLGIELLRELRDHCKIPAIAVSGHAYPADIEAALAAGFARYLVKPFDRDALLSAVRATLEESQGTGETGTG
jgi:DNA-binding response OmpR family regulator